MLRAENKKIYLITAVRYTTEDFLEHFVCDVLISAAEPNSPERTVLTTEQANEGN